VTGGCAASNCSTATAVSELYDPASNSWSTTGILNTARYYHTAVRLKTGKVLAIGGSTGTAGVYTPLTLTFSASSLNFGLLQTGLTSASQTVTVTNVSSHSATFTSIASSGDFSQNNTCPTTTTLDPGQNCMITVTFSPTAAGTRTGAVTLKDNCPGSPTQTITLSGTGETGALGFTPASLNLGNAPVGSSNTQSVTVTNDGAAAVNITGIAISPSGGTFTQTNNCPATLNVQQTCTFQIVFTPPDVFTYNATLSITNSANGPANLSLSGTGLDGP
jgi:hypothetical protein